MSTVGKGWGDAGVVTVSVTIAHPGTLMHARTLGKLCLQVLLIYNNFRKADHTSNETDKCQSEILIGMIKLILSDICSG